MTVAVILPALDEVATIAGVVHHALDALGSDVLAVIVVDGGSRDGTVEAARGAGAVVVSEPRRGYGRACATGVAEAVRLGASVLAFVDAAGAEDPHELPGVVAPVLRDEADLVVGSRTRGTCEDGALRPAQRAGNRLATWLIWCRTGLRYSDLGSMRAISAAALARLDMSEMGHGWPSEMQMKAARAGMRVLEIPVCYRRRRAGRSKVSGSPLGAVRAGVTILRVVLGPAGGMGSRSST